MWRMETKEYDDKTLAEVIEFTGNHFLYGSAMFRVIIEWPLSCEHFLSNKNINRKAWIGHAACCIEKIYPEYIVRTAWGLLTEEQRVKANNVADQAIITWEINFNHRKTNSLQLSLWSNESNHTLDCGRTDATQMASRIKHRTN